MDFEIGQIVFSKRGRDKKTAFVIIKVEDAYVYLVDGNIRPFHKPKKKKYKHVQHTLQRSDSIKCKLENGDCILDAEFRSVLKKYNQKQ